MSIARQPASCGASASVVDDAAPAAIAVHHAPDLSHASLAPLLALVEAHPLWQCRLFAACQAGELTLSDFRYLFGQYHEYSRNFTRYLAGVVASCDSDYLRARLTQNLWEEGGGTKPERRHSEHCLETEDLHDAGVNAMCVPSRTSPAALVAANRARDSRRAHSGVPHGARRRFYAI